MTEMDQHGGISSLLDDDSEKQQQSYYSGSEDIASLQDKWPSFNQATPHALETPTSKAKTEDVPENVNNGKGVLESAGASKLSEEAANQQNCGQATQRHESGGSSGKKRRSRWDPMPEEGGVANEGESSGKKRSRWATEDPKISMLGQTKLADFVKKLSGKKKRSKWAKEQRKLSRLGISDVMKDLADTDPEVWELKLKLFNITNRLHTGNVIGASGDGQRSPSPEPQYNNLGMRINTREIRARQKLMDERQMIIARLIKKTPAFRPPADYKSPSLKHHKKLYIPLKEYPGYNFVEIILGPHGNTQKRMEQETGAKILLRGRGSKRDSGSHMQDLFPDPPVDEDLHVLIEADNESSLEEACRMVEKLLVPLEEGSNALKQAQLKELAEIKKALTDNVCGKCGQEGHIRVNCPNQNQKKVSLQGATVDSTNEHDLCSELETGKSAVSMEKSGSGIPRQSIQPLGPTDNYMPWLAQAGGLEHPQNGNAGIGSEVMRVLMENRGSEIPIQSSQPLGFTDKYMTGLAGGLEQLENGNTGIVPGKVSSEKSVSGLPRQSVQSLGLTDNYMSWLTGGLQHPESGKDGLGHEIKKVSVEKSRYGLPRQSTQSPGPRDNYMSWLAGGLEHTENGSAGIGPDIRKGGGFGTSSVQGSRPYGYSPYSSHVGLESSFDSPSFSHKGLGSHFEHNHGKEIDHSTVYVGYLPPTMEEEQLIKLFSSFGRIVEAKVIRDDVKGSGKGYGFVKFNNIHCTAQAIVHMNGYRLEGKTLAVMASGWPPSGSGVGPAEALYTFDKQQSPRLPVHSGDYAQPSWSAPTRPVSSFPYNYYSDNNGSGMPSHSVSPLQGGTFKSLPATSYCTYDLYQMPLPSSGMQGPLRSQKVLDNVHDSLISKLNVHSADAMSQFSPNQTRISTYQHYAPPSIPSGSAYSGSPSRGSLMGGLGTPPLSSSLFSSGYEKKAMELEYERFLSKSGL